MKNNPTNLRRYKIIDVFGNLKTVLRPPEIMSYYVDIGLAMDALPDYDGWKACYKGSIGAGGRIAVEPHEWDKEKMALAYAPLIQAYRRIIGGQIRPPGYWR